MADTIIAPRNSTEAEAVKAEMRLRETLKLMEYYADRGAFLTVGNLVHQLTVRAKAASDLYTKAADILPEGESQTPWEYLHGVTPR